MVDTFIQQAVNDYFSQTSTFDPEEIIKAAFENEKVYFASGKVSPGNMESWITAANEKLASLGVNLDLQQKLAELISNGKIGKDSASGNYEWK